MNSNEEEGSIEFSFAGLFKCLLCTHPKGNEEKVQLMHIASTLEKLEKKLESVERLVIFSGNVFLIFVILASNPSTHIRFLMT